MSETAGTVPISTYKAPESAPELAQGGQGLRERVEAWIADSHLRNQNQTVIDARDLFRELLANWPDVDEVQEMRRNAAAHRETVAALTARTADRRRIVMAETITHPYKLGMEVSIDGNIDQTWIITKVIPPDEDPPEYWYEMEYRSGPWTYGRTAASHSQITHVRIPPASVVSIAPTVPVQPTGPSAKERARAFLDKYADRCGDVMDACSIIRTLLEEMP